MKMNMSGQSTKWSPLYVTLEALRWEGQAHTLLSE